jgi:ABC-type transport system involved in multi-copper enzyme maturation permease subunit
LVNAFHLSATGCLTIVRNVWKNSAIQAKEAQSAECSFIGGFKLRLGPGPVFVYEWLTTSRRWQLYGLRAAFVGAILIGMMFVWHQSRTFANPTQAVSFQTLARYGEELYETIVSIELTLVLLAAPAATAGAICLDKARGTLDHMLATDLSNAEIVLGKIGVRLVPVIGLIACVLPVAALGGLLGGIDPLALLGSFVTAIACAVLGCSLALTVSVWGRKTHEVLMATYLILILWVITPLLALTAAFSLQIFKRPLTSTALTAWEWLECSNPYYLAFAPYSEPGKVGLTTYLGFLGSCLFVSALLLGLATHRIRGVALTQAGQLAVKARSGRLTGRFWRPKWLICLPGPSLDGNPVLWREWHRSRPSRLLRVVWLLYSTLGILGIVLSFHIVTQSQANEEMLAMTNMFQVSVGLLLLSVSAATSLAEERVRGSLDVLLSTPLSSRSILAGKWWGTFRQTGHVLVWPAIVAGLLLAQSGRWISYLLLMGLILSYSAVITSLGLALATWVSRLGRAVALCVSTYVVFSIGWVILVILFFPTANTGISFVMGSPLYGAAFATDIVASGQRAFVGNENAIRFGAFVWIMVDAGVAVLLFMVTLAMFDRCLGRVSEITGRTMPYPRKKDNEVLEPDLADWFAESSGEVSESPCH